MGKIEGQELEMKGRKVGSDESRRVQQLQQVQRRRAVRSVERATNVGCSRNPNDEKARNTTLNTAKRASQRRKTCVTRSTSAD